MPGAEVGGELRNSGQQQGARRNGSRRAVAAMKRKPADPDLPTMAEGLREDNPDRDRWFQAMQEEVDALREHGTFSLVFLPRGKHFISCNGCLRLSVVRQVK